MANEIDPTQQWDRVASELRAYKQTQEQAWGDIDNGTLGRYLANDLSGDEREQIEQALTQLPELRKLTDIVRDVLDEFDPAAPVPLPEAPKVLPFPQRRTEKRFFGRVLRQRGALLAAACVLLGLGLTVGGMRLFSSKAREDEPVSWDGSRAELDTGREKSSPFAAPNSRDKQADPKKQPEPKQLTEEEMLDGWKKLGNSAVSVVATAQEQVGEYYQKQGDLDRAEPFLANAVEMRRKSGDRAGDNDKAKENLANVYQLALNTPSAEARQMHVMAKYSFPLPAVPLALMAKRDHAYEKACDLRERITKQSPEEVKQSVVPVLVHAFRTAKTPEERQTFVRALGNLGPAAADAVRDLQTAFETKETTNDERVVLAWALGQIGPAARPAVPALMDSLQGNCPEVKRAAGEALVKLSPYARQDVFSDGKKESLPRELVTRMESPEGRSGVNDACLSYSPHALHETQRQIQQLARRHHVELYTETVASLTAKDAKNADERIKEARTNGIYILICKEPPSVQVVVSEEMQKKGFSPEFAAELKKVAEESVKKRDFERGLVQSVRYVAQRFDQVANRRKIAAGAVMGGVAETIVPQ